MSYIGRTQLLGGFDIREQRLPPTVAGRSLCVTYHLFLLRRASSTVVPTTARVITPPRERSNDRSRGRTKILHAPCDKLLMHTPSFPSCNTPF
eukprot:9271994-Pyramimonas_sp.AAC.3